MSAGFWKMDLAYIKRKCIINERGCWIFQGKKNDGYGQIQYRGVNWPAHRLAYKFKYGESPKNDGGHSCATRACANPEHIIDQTRSENMTQSVKDGTGNTRISIQLDGSEVKLTHGMKVG